MSGSSLGPDSLKIMPGACACVPKIPREEWRRRGCCVAIPWGCFLSLSLFPVNEWMNPKQQERGAMLRSLIHSVDGHLEAVCEIAEVLLVPSLRGVLTWVSGPAGVHHEHQPCMGTLTAANSPSSRGWQLKPGWAWREGAGARADAAVGVFSN